MFHIQAVIITATGFFVIVILCILVFVGTIQINNPDKSRFPIRGIDISHHQQMIDWEALKSEYIRFIFIKATEGGDYQDPLFAENCNNAKKTGFVRGAYHFYTF